jgi:hypothetical protein
MFNSYLRYGYIIVIHWSSSNFIMFCWFRSYSSWSLKKKEIFSRRSFSPQQLYTFNSNFIYGYVRNAQVKFEFGHGSMIFVRDKYAPLTLKKGNFQFLFIIFLTVVQLIFNIWIYHSNTQVKFKFGHGLMISELFILNFEIFFFSFSSLSSQQLYTCNSNLTYIYISGISLNLVMDRWCWTMFISLECWNKLEIFSFRNLTFVEV